MKIYTRKGDDGSTGLFGGSTVRKSDPRVDAYGTVDETNAVLGWARAVPLPPAVEATLALVQASCFRVGAWLASAPGVDPGVPVLSPDDVGALEAAIDALEEGLPPLEHFVLPGGSEGAARLHIARTVARRAERAVTLLAGAQTVEPSLLAWLNRLSDYLFVAARAVNAADGVDESLWAPRT